MRKHSTYSLAWLIKCSIILVLASFGCSVHSTEAEAPEITGQLAGLFYTETLAGRGEEGAELPMLIGLHYMSGSRATSIQDYGELNVPVRLLSIEGPHRFEQGFSWFPEGYYDLDAESQLAITVSLSNRIASFIKAATRTYPTRGKPILTGFSQGADLTHMIALREPELILAGLPMGGRFPDEWLGAANRSAALPKSVVLFHGAADEAVNVSQSIAAASYYTANNVTVVLRTYAGVGHSYPAQMKSDFQSTIKRLVDTLSD